MLSTLIKTAHSTPYFLQDTDTKTSLVNVHYQENNYQALLEYIQNGEDHGWILFLAPPGKPNVQFFQNAGIDKSRVLMIDSNKVDDNLALLSTLLKSSNYNTVVVWVNELSAQARASIERDAEKTNTGCFVYCKQ
jgi:cell division inhibitor SulA